MEGESKEEGQEMMDARCGEGKKWRNWIMGEECSAVGKQEWLDSDYGLPLKEMYLKEFHAVWKGTESEKWDELKDRNGVRGSERDVFGKKE